MSDKPITTTVKTSHSFITRVAMGSILPVLVLILWQVIGRKIKAAEASDI